MIVVRLLNADGTIKMTLPANLVEMRGPYLFVDSGRVAFFNRDESVWVDWSDKKILGGVEVEQ